MKKLSDVFSGYFLANKDAIKNWKFILVMSVLAIIIIDSGHRADKKIYKIAQLNNEIKKLRSEVLENKNQLMNLKIETNLISTLKKNGLSPSKNPPTKIILKKQAR